MINLKTMLSRRLFGKAAAGGIAAMTVAQNARATIPVTEISTLSKLAAIGEYFSVDLNLPRDCVTRDLTFYCDGKEIRNCKEVFAPKKGDGWIVFFHDNTKILGELFITGKITYVDRGCYYARGGKFRVKGDKTVAFRARPGESVRLRSTD